MPIKLQVVKEEDEGEPADYLFEQDRITIGRGSSNDLTLPDQKVSTEHAEIRTKDGDYHLWDRDSKNKTYVDGRRVGEEEPYVLGSGDVFHVGDFKIEFAPLFMPSSEKTTYADSEDTNPFAKHTRDLAAALEGLVETYKFAPSDQREASLSEAVRDHFDLDVGNDEGLQHILRELESVAGSSDATTEVKGARGDDDAFPKEVIEALFESVARMIEIPDRFWREFTGSDLDRPPEQAALYEADPEELRRYLVAGDLSAEKREQRLAYLDDAVESLVAHSMAMLTGYRTAVMAGSKKLLDEVDPTDAVDEETKGTGMVNFLGGGGNSELEQLKQRWQALYQQEVETNFFRPTYVETYVDRMAEAWDVDRAEIVSEQDAV